MDLASRRALSAVALAVLLALPAAAKSAAAPAPKEQAWVTKSNQNAQLLLQVFAKYAPEGAGGLGVDGLDQQITDLSRDQFEPANADTRAAIAELEQRLAAETDAKVKQDLAILINSARDNITTGTLNRKYFFPFNDITAMVYGVVQQTLDPRIPKARQKTVLVRLEKYAGLAKGYRPIAELAKERTLERLAADPKLMGPFKGEVDQALNDAPTLLKGIKDELTKSGLKGWDKSYAALEQQLNAYTAWVKDFVLPRARTDHRLPPEVYADNLKQFGVDIGPEELISKALTSFAEMRNQANITAGMIAKERGFADADYRAVIREIKKTQMAKD